MMASPASSAKTAGEQSAKPVAIPTARIIVRVRHRFTTRHLLFLLEMPHHERTPPAAPDTRESWIIHSEQIPQRLPRGKENPPGSAIPIFGLFSQCSLELRFGATFAPRSPAKLQLLQPHRVVRHLPRVPSCISRPPLIAQKRLSHVIRENSSSTMEID